MAFKSLLLVLISLVFISCGESKKEKIIESYSDDLVTSSLATQAQKQYSVYAHYSDGSKTNITNSLLWRSSDTTLARVTNGLVESYMLLGDVNISYETYEKLSDGTLARQKAITLTLEKLNLSSISLAPLSLELALGKSAQLQVNAIYENNQTAIVTQYCDFNSSNALIATVDENATVRGVAEGNATITAIHKDTNKTATSQIVVSSVAYKDLKMLISKTDFNVEQTLSMSVEANNSRGESVVLLHSDLDWKSSEPKVISIKDGIATALTKGTSTITATLKAAIDPAMPSTTQKLSVKKDEYMRLFDKDGVELSFDTPVDNYFTKNQVNNLDEFTIRAVGKTFSISDVKIEDFIGGDIMANQMAFIELNPLNSLVKDTNRTFKLHYDEQREELIYSFKIDDSVGSRFVQRYIAE